VQTNVLIKEECILKNKNKLYTFKKLSVFYKSRLKTFGSHVVCFSSLLALRFGAEVHELQNTAVYVYDVGYV
jgi:hypothetical protein